VWFLSVTDGDLPSAPTVGIREGSAHRRRRVSPGGRPGAGGGRRV